MYIPLDKVLICVVLHYVFQSFYVNIQLSKNIKLLYSGIHCPTSFVLLSLHLHYYYMQLLSEILQLFLIFILVSLSSQFFLPFTGWSLPQDFLGLPSNLYTFIIFRTFNFVNTFFKFSEYFFTLSHQWDFLLVLNFYTFIIFSYF